MSDTQRYTEQSIRVLKGLEPVRQTPGMYTRTESPMHIVTEVIDNASDEAIGGFCKRIDVTVHTDGSVSVRDNGRGIPVGIHPGEGVPTVEVVFTRLHAGSKFTKGTGGVYAFSGGLHGVGVSVTNALSTRLEVSVAREGAFHTIVFENGEVSSPLSSGPIPHGFGRTGTLVRVWPDGKYFDNPNVPEGELKNLLESKAILLEGVLITLTNEKTGEKLEWKNTAGLAGYLSSRLASAGTDPVIPVFEGQAFEQEDSDLYAQGEGAQFVCAFTRESAPVRASFVNLIPTAAGGTHENGLRDGLYQAVSAFIDLHAMLPKGLKLTADDVFSRTSFILSAKISDPQFQGQTKERLNSRTAVRLVSSLAKSAFETWLHQNPADARILCELAIEQARNRSKALQKIERKKSSSVAVLPGKLTDCETPDITRNELFLVEGDSAGGSAKLGRDKEFQAVLPLRGKVLNSWETDRDRLFTNTEIQNIATAIGVMPHGQHEDADLSGLRYGKICILSDADVDGSHIQVLLLTLFLKHFPRLIENGHVYVARPPLYRVDQAARGKRGPQKHYALDDTELAETLSKLKREKVSEKDIAVSRFKGLGEMNAEQLWETTLNPDTRRLLPVTFGEKTKDETTSRFQMLMGKNEAASRRAWMEAHGNEADADV